MTPRCTSTPTSSRKCQSVKGKATLGELSPSSVDLGGIVAPHQAPLTTLPHPRSAERANMSHRRLIRLLGLVLLGVLAGARVGSTQQEPVELRPNLVALPASEFQMTLDGRLQFATTSWNNGKGPLELWAGATSTAGQDVWQRVYYSDGSYQEYLAGTFDYHPEHGHFHFNNYALYTLKQVGAPGGSEKTSQKTSFCIMDTTKFNTSLPGAPANAVYVTCTAAYQGMSVGWGDRYGPLLAGQSFDMTGSPDGDYDLTIQIDPPDAQHPAGRLLEITESDNVSCVRLHISTGATNRTVQSLGPCSSVTIASIVPNTAAPGTSVNVTITGTGFAPGMAVGFENGTGGSAPVAKNVAYVSPTEYRATVVVKKGGGKQTKYWDVRVGSGVLPRGFIIQP